MTNSVSYNTFNICRFRGVDYTDSELNMNVTHSPDMMNLIPYENGAVRSRGGYETVFKCDGQINGIYQLREQKGIKTLVHHGNKIGEWRQSDVVNSLYGYTVPATSEDDYYYFRLFVIGDDVTFRYGNSAIGSSDTVTYDGNNNKLYVNGNKQYIDSNNPASPIPVVITKCSAEISKDDFEGRNPRSVALDLSHVELDENYHFVNVEKWAGIDNVSISHVSADGTEIICDLTNNTATVGSHSYNITLYDSLPIRYVQPRAILVSYVEAKEATIKSGYDGKVTYSFRIDGDSVAKCRIDALQPNDLVAYDKETGKLYINSVDTEIDNELAGGQVIDLDVLDEDVSVINDFEVVVPDKKSSCQQVGNKLYIFTGQTAYVYGEWETDADGNNITPVYELRKMADEAYTPTVLISSSPVITGSNGKVTTSGGGVKYEDYNLLSNKAKVQFLVSSGSSSKKLPLPRSPVENVEKVEKLTEDGEWEEVSDADYTLDHETGIITFTQNLSSTPVNGRDNYRITFVMGWFGETKPRHYVKKVSPETDLNFNPPHIKKFASKVPQDKYQEYTDGKKFTAVKHRILLGDIKESDDVSVRVSNTSGKMVFGYCSSGRIREVNAFKFTASTTATEYVLKITKSGGMSAILGGKINGTNREYQIELGERISSKEGYAINEKGRDTTWGAAMVYTQVVKDGDNYYLDITQPYVLYYTKGRFANRTICIKETAVFDKIEIDYTEKKHEYLDRIDKATICTKFGASGNVDRLFVAGWDEMREYEFWSEMGNPLYFPDLNYACLGDEDTAIMGWSRINNNQMAIHKNSNGSDPTVYIQSASLSQNTAQVENAKSGTLQLLSTFSVTFPVTEGPAGDGVISQRAFGVLCGEPLALSEKGVFATKYVADIAADVRYAVPRSYYINPKLKECDLSDAEAIVFNNRYYLSLGDGRVFVADGAQRYAVGGDSDESSFEWFPWDNVPARIWWVSDDRLYFGTADGRICRFTDGFMDIDKPVKAYWTSPWLDFGTQTYYKKIKNVVLTCTEPRTDFSEVNIDYIGKNGAKTVKSYLIDNTSHLGVIPSIATNRKAKKVTGLKVRVRSDNAEDFGIMALSFLYIVSGKYKG